ncbi:hypothetical protein KDK95_31590 [Actinospica sp. MGRD01-02]|uniref:Uncharacterized protein n=1 Tax=Actinospica acidithermotolerans TaxID=2828514 RepID=A0A941EHQ2_9ACTN|nr:hypothetical protein [Actinospica acidithermotolerans]MBR7830890.1 hypothetical protein [Actinospica acidithermotolerans]
MPTRREERHEEILHAIARDMADARTKSLEHLLNPGSTGEVYDTAREAADAIPWDNDLPPRPRVWCYRIRLTVDGISQHDTV